MRFMRDVFFSDSTALYFHDFLFFIFYQEGGFVCGCSYVLVRGVQLFSHSTPSPPHPQPYLCDQHGEVVDEEEEELPHSQAHHREQSTLGIRLEITRFLNPKPKTKQSKKQKCKTRNPKLRNQDPEPKNGEPNMNYRSQSALTLKDEESPRIQKIHKNTLKIIKNCHHPKSLQSQSHPHYQDCLFGRFISKKNSDIIT